MKLKKIESIIKGEKTIVIAGDKDYHGNGQWLGTAEAFYPVYNLPQLNKEIIFTMFDISEKSREDFQYIEIAFPSLYDSADSIAAEAPLSKYELKFKLRGTVLQPVFTKDEAYLIDEKYLKPFDGEVYELYRRTNPAGKPYIVAKNGLVINGIISPFDLKSSSFTDGLQTLIRSLRYASAKYQDFEEEE